MQAPIACTDDYGISFRLNPCHVCGETSGMARAPGGLVSCRCNTYIAVAFRHWNATQDRLARRLDIEGASVPWRIV